MIVRTIRGSTVDEAERTISPRACSSRSNSFGDTSSLLASSYTLVFAMPIPCLLKIPAGRLTYRADAGCRSPPPSPCACREPCHQSVTLIGVTTSTGATAAFSLGDFVAPFVGTLLAAVVAYSFARRTWRAQERRTVYA